MHRQFSKEGIQVEMSIWGKKRHFTSYIQGHANWTFFDLTCHPSHNDHHDENKCSQMCAEKIIYITSKIINSCRHYRNQHEVFF